MSRYINLKQIREKLDKKFEGRERTREMVRIRDGHRCCDCKTLWREGQRRFDIHHINDKKGESSRGYDRVIDVLKENHMITLCHHCHMQRERENGKIYYHGRGHKYFGYILPK